MKRLKKIILLIIIILFSITITGCQKKEYISGNFKYHMKNNNAYIYALSEEGSKEKVIIMPNYLEGYRTGMGGLFSYYGVYLPFDSKNLEKIYFNTDILNNFEYSERRTNWRSLESKCKIFLPFYNELFEFYRRNPFYYDTDVIASKEYVDIEIEKLTDKEYFTDRTANVSYYYNYDNSETINWKTYYIDDIDGDIISSIPPEPIRTGYTFKGWYKEKECINEWNFKEDKIPSKIIDEEGNYIYVETVLYAKWE